MKTKWHIDYKNCIAKCSQMEVVIKNENNNMDMQKIKEYNILASFTMIGSGKTYECHILYISEALIDKLKDNILPKYMSQLGDTFNEFEWNDARIKDIKTFLGKKPTDADLARYLDVTRGAVSQYDKKKKELMKLGLWMTSFRIG